MTATAAVEMRCDYDLGVEVRTEARGGDVVAWQSASDDVADAVDETFTSGVLAGVLPAEDEHFAVAVEPVFDPEPWVTALAVTVSTRTGASYQLRFLTGRWDRRALAVARARAGDDRPLHASLCAQRTARSVVRAPRLEPLACLDSTLAAFGVRALGEGSVLGERPVLVCARAVADIVAATRQAGANEIGGGMLGALLRLPEPLAGTHTRFVTVLTACVSDARHIGGLARLQFDPQAMADALQMAELRGRGERVLTAFHSHGWGRDCGRCNESAQCTLPTVEQVSLDDYQVLEALFPSKTSLLPIAGRRLGAPGQQPVLAVHAWRGGRVEPIAWQTYSD